MASERGAGVVGVGFMGTAHSRSAVLAGARLVGVAAIGSHCFDLVEFVLGDRVSRRSARTATVFDHRPTEDAALVQFETAGGALGSVVISQVSPGRKNALVVELSGTEATGRFDQE